MDYIVDHREGVEPEETDGPVFTMEPYIGSDYNESDVLYLHRSIIVNYTLPSAPDVLTCGMWACVQAYNSSVTGGVQSQVVTANWSKGETVASSEASAGPWFQFTNLPEELFNSKNITFTIGAATTAAFLNTGGLQGDSLLEGNVTWGPGGQLSNTIIYSSDLAQYIFQGENWHYWIDQVALSMTNEIRKASLNSEGVYTSSVSSDFWTNFTTQDIVNTNVSRFEGQAWSIVPVVHVRWAWLCFPALMVAGSVVILGASMLQTIRHHIEPRKSSIVPLMVASVDEDLQKRDWKEVGEERIWFDDSSTPGMFRRVVRDVS